jgi:uncharacterized protein (TIGR02271 family)
MAADDRIHTRDQVVPLVEERLRVDTRETVRGHVRIRVSPETWTETVRRELRGEEIEVERVPVDREVSELPEVRTEGDVTIVPIVEEVLVVEKRLRLKEELHLRRRSTLETVEMPVTLRRERAEVERSSGGAADPVTPRTSTEEES